MVQIVAGRKAEGWRTSKTARTVYDLQDMIDCIDGGTLQAGRGGRAQQIFLHTRYADGIDTDTCVTAGKIVDIAGAELKNHVNDGDLLKNYGICGNNPALLSFALPEEELVCL